jgi:acyl-CoA synthetase (AMP-forming)/AMP-acid ligase II
MRATIACDSLVLGKLLERNARYRPRHAAMVAPSGAREVRLDFAGLDAYVNRYANLLGSLGVARGDRVASVLANSLELATLYWACAKLGCAAVPLSPLLNASGLASLLSDATPRVVLASNDQRAVLDAVRERVRLPDCRFVLVDASAEDETAGFAAFGPLHAAAAATPPGVRVSPDDMLTLMYTSGTTGLPKGIVHTHFIRAMYALTLASAWRMQPSSVVLHTGAIVFNGAMVTMLPAMMLGATYIVHRAFDPERFVDTVEAERVTHVMLVPSQVMAVLDTPGFEPSRLTSLQMILSLGAPLPVQAKERLNRLLPDRFYELYGLTEGFVTILDRDDAARKAGSVGVPPPFYELRIVDGEGRDLPAGEPGEIVGRGPITMPGYYERPEQTAATLKDGWVHTGDVGYLDADGYLYLVDRIKDMIDSGGVKVYPRDIEEVAARHPAVREAAVFGVPHQRWGETPVCAVILRRGEQAAPEALREWINARVAARYQKVEQVLVYEEFPRNAAGKTLKRELRAPFWKEQG